VRLHRMLTVLECMRLLTYSFRKTNALGQHLPEDLEMDPCFNCSSIQSMMWWYHDEWCQLSRRRHWDRVGEEGLDLNLCR